MASDSSTYDPHAAAAALVTTADYSEEVVLRIGKLDAAFYQHDEEARQDCDAIRREVATALAAAHAQGRREGEEEERAALRAHLDSEGTTILGEPACGGDCGRPDCVPWEEGWSAAWRSLRDRVAAWADDRQRVTDELRQRAATEGT
jgi:hypothetical protein